MQIVPVTARIRRMWHSSWKSQKLFTATIIIPPPTAEALAIEARLSAFGSQARRQKQARRSSSAARR